MSATEILKEINKLPLSEQRALADQLQQSLSSAESADDLSIREREFELEMLAEGFLTSIRTQTSTDDEFEDFEPLEIEGEPLSEQIIRERI